MASLSRHAGAEDFHLELGEVHLSELEFLLAQRLRHQRNPEVPWPSLARLEARALAHADGVAWGAGAAAAPGGRRPTQGAGVRD